MTLPLPNRYTATHELRHSKCKIIVKGSPHELPLFGAARQTYCSVGAEAFPSSVEGFAAYLKSETAQFAKLIRDAGIRPD